MSLNFHLPFPSSLLFLLVLCCLTFFHFHVLVCVFNIGYLMSASDKFTVQGIRKMETICFHCKVEEVKLQHCSGCGSIFLCSKECQRNSWSFHRSWCRSLPSARKEYGIAALHFLDYHDLAARNLMLLDGQPEKKIARGVPYGAFR